MICERRVQLSVEAELQEAAELLASINNAERGESRAEERTNIQSGLREEPEKVQFSGIACHDRGGERGKQ